MSKIKNVLKSLPFKVICCAVAGFLCGHLVDSAFFGINPVFAGVVEGALLSLVGYVSLKDGGLRL